MSHQPSSSSLNDAAHQAYARFEQEIAELRMAQLRLLKQLQQEIDAHHIEQLHDQLKPSDE